MAAPSSDESDRVPHRGAGGLDSTKVFVSEPLPASPPAVGRRLGDFHLVRVVGQGAMGTVYEAQDLTLNRRVALKVLRWDVGGATVERFVREANIVAQLHHTNIVPIFQVGSEGDVHYYAMQFIEGRTLYQAVRQARIDARQAAQWTSHAAEALSHAHQYNVIHRDVKPSNILLDRDGRIWLTDFGLARGLDDPTLTAANFAVGTPHYMSPEQASAQRNLDDRTDIYSLGATLYELVTGQPVFNGKSSHELIEAILTTDPEPPRRLNRQIPRDLETIVLKCLEKDPGKRYGSASALADDLCRFLNTEPIQARRVGPIVRTPYASS